MTRRDTELPTVTVQQDFVDIYCFGLHRHGISGYIVTAYIVTAYVVMACIAMACTVTAYIVMAYIVMAMAQQPQVATGCIPVFTSPLLQYGILFVTTY